MVFYERLVPPWAIVLFGPPGTGKTTFAKGAASRRAARPGPAGGDLGPLPGCVLT
jgi:predicted NACHT family NTPase